jgi:hypothetical protein
MVWNTYGFEPGRRRSICASYSSEPAQANRLKRTGAEGTLLRMERDLQARTRLRSSTLLRGWAFKSMGAVLGGVVNQGEA